MNIRESTLEQELDKARSYNAHLREENQLLHTRVVDMKRLLELVAVDSDDIVVHSLRDHLARMEDENKNLREMLALTGQGDPTHYPDSMELRSSIIPISPTHSSSSFHLTTPPRSPPTNTQRRSASGSTHDQAGADTISPAGFTNMDTPDLGTFASDIADIGPPMSPPATSLGNMRLSTVPDDNEAETNDRAELQQGTREVNDDLNR